MSDRWQDAQFAVLGSALLEPSLVGRALTETSETDYEGPSREVWKAMRALYDEGAGVDPVTVCSKIGTAHIPFIKQLLEITPTAANFDLYLKIVRQQSRLHLLHAAALDLADAEDEETAAPIVERMNDLMVDRAGYEVFTMADLLRDFGSRMEQPVQYLTWPISSLDDQLYVDKGDLIVFGGEPSAGKTAFALQCGLHWAKRKRVGFFSLETSKEKLTDRALTSMTQISFADIKRHTLSDSAWTDWAEQGERLSKLQFEVIPAAGFSATDIRSIALSRKYDVIIIDYLQLMKAEGKSRVEQVTNISLGIQRLAKSTGITVFALSQLSRARDEGTPDMSWLRESGQIEQDADVILFLTLADKKQKDGNRDLYIGKNKEGTRPAVHLAFDGQHQRFSKLEASGDVVSKYTHDGKKAREKNRAQAAAIQQPILMPDGTPVPF